MQLQEIRNILHAEVLCNAELLHNSVHCICGADLMSDVLAFTKEKTLILTGLTNAQTIRTAEMSDAVGIVFVRGKRPSKDVIDLARINKIPVMVTKYPMYEACGLLFARNIPGSLNVREKND